MSSARADWTDRMRASGVPFSELKRKFPNRSLLRTYMERFRHYEPSLPHIEITRFRLLRPFLTGSRSGKQNRREVALSEIGQNDDDELPPVLRS